MNKTVYFFIFSTLSSLPVAAQNYPPETYTPENEIYRKWKVHTVTEWQYDGIIKRTFDKQGRLIDVKMGEAESPAPNLQYIQKGDTLFRLPVDYDEKLKVDRTYYLFSRDGKLSEYGTISKGAFRYHILQPDSTIYVKHIKRTFSYDKNGRIQTEQLFVNAAHTLEEYQDGSVTSPALILEQAYEHSYDRRGKLLLRRETIGQPEWLKIDSFYYDKAGRISRIVRWQQQGLIGCVLNSNVQTEWVIKWNGNVKTVIETGSHGHDVPMVSYKNAWQEIYSRPGGLLTGIRTIKRDGTTGGLHEIMYTFYP